MLRIDSSKKAQARKQAGFIVTVELLLITTILGLGLITGFTKVRDQVIAELSDTGSAIGSINQSYRMDGTEWTNAALASPIAQVSGFGFTDATDTGGAPSDSVGGDTQDIDYIPLAATSTTTTGAGEAGVQ